MQGVPLGAQTLGTWKRGLQSSGVEAAPGGVEGFVLGTPGTPGQDLFSDLAVGHGVSAL